MSSQDYQRELGLKNNNYRVNESESDTIFMEEDIITKRHAMLVRGTCHQQGNTFKEIDAVVSSFVNGNVGTPAQFFKNQFSHYR